MRLCRVCLVLCAAAASAFGQGSATLEGYVRDSQGRPLAAATVYLQMKGAEERLTARTDTTGTYRFTGLRAGAYVLRAETGGSGEAAARPVTLDDGLTNKIDLTVEYTFFDQPNFIVAGVTDPISRGGHGSDTVLRSTEALTKATAALAKPSLGSAADGRKDALATVREYQRLAESDPSESNLFDWGSELLVHGAAEPATEVFAKGHRLYPRSLRMLLGLAAAWYARGDYDRAARHFFEACDLDPGDPTPYMFLGKVQSIEITKLPGYAERLARFAKLYPENAWANYYYAAALWKQRNGPEDAGTPAHVQALLEKAVQMDSGLSAAYLQLGILYSDRSEDAKAIGAYQKAIAADPRMDEAHYRLGQAYERTGQKAKARQELEAYEELSKKLRQEIERERTEIQQFVIELRDVSRR